MSTLITNSVSVSKTLIHNNTQGISEAESISKIGDMIRGSLLTNKLEQIPLLLKYVIEQVKEKGGRIYIKNFWNDPKHLSLGYVGVHIKIRMPIPSKNLAGTVDKTHKYILMELQIHPEQIMDGTMNCAKEIAHRLYKMPREASGEAASSDLISSSQLIYLTSMEKLLCGAEELEGTANAIDIIQAMTKADKQMRLMLETALLLKNQKLCHGDWSERLQAVVPKDKDAVETAWMATALKINQILNLPVVKADDNDSWTNTATSADELAADALEMAPFFRDMCEQAAKNNSDCSVNFGPENKHMIKDMTSLQTKINKDRNLPMAPPACSEEDEKHRMSPLDSDQKGSQNASRHFQQIHPSATTQASRPLASYYPRLKKQIDFIKAASSSSFKMAHSYFSGRYKYLATLKAHLVPSPLANPSQTTRVQVLYGPRGVGKSELAVAFANQNMEDCSFIWSISCGSDEERLIGYQGLAKRLAIPLNEKETLSSLINKVHRKLEKNKSKPWLLILDNLQTSPESPSFPLPSSGGSILITSYNELNIQSLPPGAVLATKVLPLEPDEALHFLETVTEKPANDCKKLLDHFGCYPLVLGQVASYIKQTGIDVDDYLVNHKRSHAGSSAQEDPSITANMALEGVLNITLQQLFPSAKKWLFLCSQLNAAQIPVSYLKAWLDSENIAEEQAAIIATLEEHNLLRYNAQDKVFSMHLEVQRILRAIAAKHIGDEVVHLLVNMWQEWDFENIINWVETMKKATIWASHAAPIVEVPGRLLLDGLERAFLLERLGSWEYQNAHYGKALAYHSEALMVRKAILGENHPHVAASINSIGNCYYSQGNYIEALKVYGEALKIKRTALGENHPDVAKSLNNIGNCYYSQRNYSEALKLYSEALEIFRDALGENHPNVATILNSIGTCYGSQGNHIEALKMFSEALKIRKAAFEENHPDVAKSLNHIGNCYESQGNYTEALKLYDESFRIFRTALGENHPDVAKSLTTVGAYYYSQGNYTEALKMYGEALKIQRAALGDNHPDLAVSLSSIGLCYSSQGKYTEALKMHDEELKIKKATWGENHPRVALCLNIIASCYYSQGNYTEALKMFGEALKIRRAALGENHPNVADNLSNIGTCYASQENYNEALKVHFEALKIRRAALGENHPDIAMSLNNIGKCYRRQENYIEALKIYEEALRIQRAALEENHLDIASNLSNIGTCYASQENYNEALKVRCEALRIEKAVLGDNHPNLVNSLDNIASCYYSQRNYTEALKMFDEALKIRRAALEENHLDIASNLSNIGTCYASQENYNEALKVRCEALKIRRAALEENHPDIAMSLNNIGTCYASQEKYEEALKVHYEALKIRKVALGENHLDVAMSLNNIGKCYRRQGNYTEALKIYEEALRIHRAALEENHPDIPFILSNIATCYYTQGNYTEALKFDGEALKIRKAALGENHPDVAMSLNNIGTCYASQGNYEESLKVHYEALKIERAALGDNHPAVAMTLRNIEECQARLNPPQQPS